ncbi:M16 family metallopeptidase [Cecembia lonarensis]|uniref:Protease3 n=1 Tax=Cecembia lonarensis (strain CCUG 58316 / KCTC 22772 / LW9) TaxID=1225176 RepID=K1LCZ0_CECL9|nr:M16 family metallopeptidase [Cecembia lonarensis]EKB48243.1 protease3 [Cecembia lonarensis LW9]
MKKLLLILFVLTAGTVWAQSSYETVQLLDGPYSYSIVKGDPTNTRFYTLPNGLQVILHENRTEPKIFSLFTTRAGSKNDPATHTGLAHYLEHLLFKGTQNIGTLDFEKEKVYLKQIEGLYEEYNQTSVEQERKAIYKRIDSVSTLASQLAIANEYDKIMSFLGSDFTNAFTSFENTSYMEFIPANNLEKLLAVQKERFSYPIFRLFHTELETVYEEYNMYQDMGNFRIFDQMFAGLFKKHPYGTQTTLGSAEHLKNPSLPAISRFYKQYYVPNNMVVILAGDLDFEESIRLVDKYFGSWEPGEVPAFAFEREDPIDRPEEYFITTPDEENVAVGFRMPATKDGDALKAELVSYILSNGRSGLMDQNLVKAQKVLEADAYDYLLTDYGLMFFSGRPLEGQDLKEVRSLMLEQIDLLKSGDFDEDLIEGTINNFKVQRLRRQESPIGMALIFNELFTTQKSWESYLSELDEMSNITKADIVDFSNRWFGDNHVTVFKLTGKDSLAVKIEKPEITAITINRDDQSAYFKEITSNPSEPLQPVFLNFEEDIKFGSVHQDVPLWVVPNTLNNLFNMYFVFDMGNRHIPKLPLAVEYLRLIGSESKSNEQINKELYNLAINFNISTGDDLVYVWFSGLEENRQEAMTIIQDLIRNAKPNQEALAKMVEAKIKERNDKTINKDEIFFSALNNYVDYGAENPYNTVLSNEELRQLKAEELTDLIRSLFGYKHKVYYYGVTDKDDLEAELKQSHPLVAELKDYPPKREFERLKADKNQVYFVDYDMAQVEISLQRWDEENYDPAEATIVRAFNEYYGGNMSSVVFQEIREARGLAYSTYGFFSTPAKKEDPYKAGFYVGTQADKMAIAFDAMFDLINNFKESEQSWNISKGAIKTGIASERITKTAILFNYQSALKRGLNHDIRSDIYENIDGVLLQDIKKFHADKMKDKSWNIRMVGSKEKLNWEDLKKVGDVKELTIKEIFGF